MTVTPPADPRPPFPRRNGWTTLRSRYRHWRNRRRWAGEMARVAALGRREPLPADIGLTRAQFDVLMNLPEDAGRPFEAMAAANDVDLTALPAPVLRDAMWTCMVCRSNAACRRWLRGDGWQGGDPRCPNAPLLRH